MRRKQARSQVRSQVFRSMRTRSIVLISASALLIAAVLAIGGIATATAGEGGCPSESSANGAAHANSRSAHGYQKRAARGCDDPPPAPSSATPTPEPTPTPTLEPPTPTPTPAPTPTPTPLSATPSPTPTPSPTSTPTPTPTPTPAPTPTPTPEPADQADVVVEDVSVRAPDSALPGESFIVRVTASLRNLGPASAVLVDTTFTFSVPGCDAIPSLPVTVQDTDLPQNIGVSIGRSWLVSCAQAGTAASTVDVDIVIDASQAITDPDATNNSGSGSDSTIVGP